MNNLVLITKALEYIEGNLTDDLKTEDISRNLYCSKSSLEKLFRIVTNMSIRDYVIRRRMSKAARDIVSQSYDESFLNLAVKYGYGSNEAFTRAFKGIWHMTPSEYKRNPVRYELFPALRLDPELMEDVTMTTRKKVDISELYDYIQERRDFFIVAIDIKSLVPINEISHEAGDLAILTALNRLSDACGEEDIVFRIGGDEFVALTNSKEGSYAEAIIHKIISQNGDTFKYGDIDIPLSLYATCYKLSNIDMKYSELFSNLQKALDVRKECVDNLDNNK